MVSEIIEKLCMIIELQTEIIRKLYSVSQQNADLDAELARIEKLKEEIK